MTEPTGDRANRRQFSTRTVPYDGTCLLGRRTDSGTPTESKPTGKPERGPSRD
jgi:hypothetical protein